MDIDSVGIRRTILKEVFFCHHHPWNLPVFVPSFPQTKIVLHVKMYVYCHVFVSLGAWLKRLVYQPPNYEKYLSATLAIALSEVKGSVLIQSSTQALTRRPAFCEVRAKMLAEIQEKSASKKCRELLPQARLQSGGSNSSRDFPGNPSRDVYWNII